MNEQQLELFAESPFALRLPIGETLDLFVSAYWQYVKKAKNTRICIERLKIFCRERGLRYVDEISSTEVAALRRWLKETQRLKDNTINGYHGSRRPESFQQTERSETVGGHSFCRWVEARSPQRYAVLIRELVTR